MDVGPFDPSIHRHRKHYLYRTKRSGSDDPLPRYGRSKFSKMRGRSRSSVLNVYIDVMYSSSLRYRERSARGVKIRSCRSERCEMNSYHMKPVRRSSMIDLSKLKCACWANLSRPLGYLNILKFEL